MVKKIKLSELIAYVFPVASSRRIKKFVYENKDSFIISAARGPLKQAKLNTMSLLEAPRIRIL
jgi:hypothetical protein